MREIKFRAWDVREKEITKSFTLQDIADVYDKGYLVYEDAFGEKLNPFCGRKMIIMQFTGLKDKNGKEIYEGDIVKSNNYTLNGEIIWDNNNACFAISNMSEDEFYNCEVIGNIYENPEVAE